MWRLIEFYKPTRKTHTLLEFVFLVILLPSNCFKRCQWDYHCINVLIIAEEEYARQRNLSPILLVSSSRAMSSSREFLA